MDRRKVVGVWYLDQSRFRVEVYEHKTGNLDGRFGFSVFENREGGYLPIKHLGAPPQSGIPEALAAAEVTIHDWTTRLAPAASTLKTKAVDHPVPTWIPFVRKWAVLVVLVPVIILVTAAPPYRNSPPIRSDGVGYYAWTKAILTRDTSFFCTSPDVKPYISYRSPRGICLNIYPPGMALSSGFPSVRF